MKTPIRILLFMSIFSLTFACADAPEGQKVESGDAIETDAMTSANAITYQVNEADSYITWEGTKPTGSHTGTVQISEGEIFVKEGGITGGEFTIDMNTILVTDPAEGEMKDKLEGHLKSGDFFEIENHPQGMFELVSVEPVSGNAEATHNLTGNLTMKGITKSVTIPAKVSMGQDQLMATTPKFTIDRTNWDITFKSGVIGTAKDKVIHDEIGLQINLSASPQQAVN